MKKVLLLLCVVVFVSCSKDTESESVNFSSSSEPVLEGGMLKFKDDESFIKEYKELSNMKDQEEIQNWISNKGLKSLLNTSNTSEGIEDDIIAEDRIIYSESLKAILNSEARMKIGNFNLWLYERNFYILSQEDLNKTHDELISLKNNLKIYGELLNYSGEKDVVNKSSLTSRDIPIPNENRTKTFVYDIQSNKSRFVLDLFNETILLHSSTISSSEMKLRGTLQYRSCSTWRCTWKTDVTNYWQFSNVNLTSTVGDFNNYPWKFSVIDTDLMRRDQSYALLATHGYLPPYDRSVRINFQVSGTISIRLANSVSFFGYPIEISWY